MLSKEKISCSDELRAIRSRNAFAQPKMDLSGRVFSQYTVLREVERTAYKQRQWLCRCSCGAERVVLQGNLTTGAVKSCGHGRGDSIAKHGYARRGKKKREHGIWIRMRARCENPSHKDYPWYGARGITVSQEWQSFDAFIADMGDAPAGFSIDRIDNNKGYSKENCRWADSYTQARNKRNTRLTMGQALEIRQMRDAGASIKTIAKAYSVSQPCISHVISGRTWAVQP